MKGKKDKASNKKIRMWCFLFFFFFWCVWGGEGERNRARKDVQRNEGGIEMLLRQRQIKVTED